MFSVYDLICHMVIQLISAKKVILKCLVKTFQVRGPFKNLCTDRKWYCHILGVFLPGPVCRGAVFLITLVSISLSASLN